MKRWLELDTERRELSTRLAFLAEEAQAIKNACHHDGEVAESGQGTWHAWWRCGECGMYLEQGMT